MQEAAPVAQHEWLKKFIGEWTYSGSCEMGPGQHFPFKGTESAREVGPFWILAEASSTTPDGQPATMILTIGFDPKQDSFVGSWIGSMMEQLWTYTGYLDDAATTLTLESEGACPGVPDGKTRKFRDVHRFITEDHREFIASMQDEQGQWIEMMRAEYRRVI